MDLQIDCMHLGMNRSQQVHMKYSLVRAISGYTDDIYSACLTLDDKFMISGNANSSILAWSLENHLEVAILNGDTYIECLYISAQMEDWQ